MSDVIETVFIASKDHPSGMIRINKADLKEGDKVVEPESKSSKDGPKEGTKAWIVAQLKEKGAEVDESLSKAKLQEQLDALQ